MLIELVAVVVAADVTDVTIMSADELITAAVEEAATGQGESGTALAEDVEDSVLRYQYRL